MCCRASASWPRAASLVLVIAFLLVDVIDNLQWFTKYHSTLDEVLRFYAARLPLIASRVVPMALLVAAALTVSLLGVTGELLGMRACGIPAAAHRAADPGAVLRRGRRLSGARRPGRAARHRARRATSSASRSSIGRPSGSRSGRARETILYQLERIDPLRGVAIGPHALRDRRRRAAAEPHRRGRGALRRRRRVAAQRSRADRGAARRSEAGAGERAREARRGPRQGARRLAALDRRAAPGDPATSKRAATTPRRIASTCTRSSRRRSRASCCRRSRCCSRAAGRRSRSPRRSWC